MTVGKTRILSKTVQVFGLCMLLTAAVRADDGKLAADFVMTRTLSVLSSSIESSGKLYLGGPGLLRWEMVAPTRSVLVVNGKTAWIHYPDMGVTKGFDLSTDPVMKILSGHLLALTVGDFKRLEQFYEVSEPGPEGSRTLVPLQESVSAVFNTIKVKADGKVVSWVEMISANGDSTKIEFKGVRLEPQLDPGLFEEPGKP